MRGGLHIRREDGRDTTAEARADWPNGPKAFDAWRLDAERQLNWSLLAGPSEVEMPSLREAGWSPEKAMEVAHRRAEQEREQATRLAEDSRWRRGRLRDVVSARYLALEVSPMLDEICARREIDFPSLFSRPEAARRFADSMPSADAWITLLTARHRNAETRWSANDIHDADALSVAVPYCDYVVTEKYATNLLRADSLPQRVGSTVVTHLEELVAMIAARNALPS